MPTTLLTKNSIIWISKNKYTFLLVLLVIGNVYQYVDRRTIEEKYFEEGKRLNTLTRELAENSLEYERKRSEKLEFVLNNLTNFLDNEKK